MLGFRAEDFAVFKIEGFSERMERIYDRVRPRLIRLGGELAPELARTQHLEFFPHVAKHARRTVNPPPETWVAFGPSPRGYKRYGYLALCISAAGLHARAVVKSEADRRGEMANRIRESAPRLIKDFKGARLAQYDKWSFTELPAGEPASASAFGAMADALDKKTGGIDVGFGWNMREAIRLDRAEVIDAFRELAPLYRILRSVA